MTAAPEVFRRLSPVSVGVAATLVAVLAVGQAVVRGAGSGGVGDLPPAGLGMVDDVTTTTEPATTTTTAPAPIHLGRPGEPFGRLPQPHEATAVMTETGVVVRVLDERDDGSWLVSTPCQATDTVTNAQPIGRAHVVLDAGHGGTEFGTVGASGLAEKDLNHQVALRTKALLEEAGATVVLTRNGDHNITAAARGEIAAAIRPALFVSIHHNGGAPLSGDQPGTIVFTKADSEGSTRFGGLFYERLTTLLEAEAEVKRLAHQMYDEALDAYEAQVNAYDQSVIARDQALVANGQLPPEAVTVFPTPTTAAPGEPRLPSIREPLPPPVTLPPTTLPPSTTQPPSTQPAPTAPATGADPATDPSAGSTAPPATAAPSATVPTVPATAPSLVPVPDTLPVPAPFLLDPVRPFQWSGGANAGVRSWTGPNGDFLAVLRESGDVPAVLAEFLYLTNPSEEALLADPAFVDNEAYALADSIIRYFSTDDEGTGHIADEYGDQPIGNSGGIGDCVEPLLEFTNEQADEN